MYVSSDYMGPLPPSEYRPPPGTEKLILGLFHSQFRKAEAGSQLSLQTRQPPSYQHLPEKHSLCLPFPGVGDDSLQRIRVPRGHNHNNNNCCNIC